MKNLKIGFVLGTILLAGATAFATKANRAVEVHYLTASGCETAMRNTVCTLAPGDTCYGTSAGLMDEKLYITGCEVSLHTLS